MENKKEIIGFEQLSKTFELWQKYSNGENSLLDLIGVAKCFVEEIAMVNTRNFSISLLTSKVIESLKSCMSGENAHLIDLLRIYQSLLANNLIEAKEFRDIDSLLIDYLDKISDEKPMTAAHISLEIIFTLATKIRSNESDPYSDYFKSKLDKALSDFLDNLSLKINSHSVSQLFNFLSESSPPSSSLINLMVERNSAKSLCDFIKSSIKSHASDSANFLNAYLKVLKIFMHFSNQIKSLVLPKICDAVIKSRYIGHSFFLSVILEGLYQRLKIIEINEVYEEIAMSIVKILLLQGLDNDLYMQYVENLSSINWKAAGFTQEFKGRVKTIVLSSRYLNNKATMIGLIEPMLVESFTVTDLKLALRQCKASNKLITHFLKLLKGSLEFTASNPSYIVVNKENPIKFEVNHKISSKEFSIWAKIYPESIDNAENMLQLQINKSLSLYCIISKHYILFTIIKDKNTIPLAEFPIGLIGNKWNTIGISASLKKKVSSKYKFVLNVNMVRKEVYLDQIGKFTEISAISINFTGRISYFKIFSAFVSENHLKDAHELKGVFSLDDFQRNYFNFNVLKLTPHSNNPEFARKIYYDRPVYTIKYFSAFDSLTAIGGISGLIGLLKYSEKSYDFELFFDILIIIFRLSDYKICIDACSLYELKAILTEKQHLANNNWLELSIEMLNSAKASDLRSLIFESILMCPGLWRCLPHDFMIFYLETLKSHLEVWKKLDKNSGLSELCVFLHSMINNTENESQVLIVKYYFDIIYTIFQHKKLLRSLRALMEFMNLILDELNILEIGGSLKNFLSEIRRMSWSVDDFDQISEFLEITARYFEFPNLNIQMPLMSLVLSIINKYLNKLPSQWQETQRLFIASLTLKFKMLMKPYLNSDVSKALIDFISRPNLISSPLCSIITSITDLLYYSSINRHDFFEATMNHLTSAVHQPQFSKILSDQISFPGWMFPFLKQPLFKYSPVFNLLLKIFSHAQNFENFEKLRIIFNQMLENQQFKLIFHFLTKLSISNNTAARIEARTFKFLNEFFNIAEDVIEILGYEKIPKNKFIRFTLVVVEGLRKIKFSISFPRIPAFGGYSSLPGLTSQIEEGITLREGGLCRQMLKFVFISMSFGPNTELERTFDIFSDESLNNDDERFEWKYIEFDKSIKRSSSLGKVSSCKNLIYIYVFTEWVELIKLYQKKGIAIEEVMKSVDRLFEFTKKCKVAMRLKNEIKCICDQKGIREYEFVKNENLNSLTSFHLKENQYIYENFRKSLGKGENEKLMGKNPDSKKSQNIKAIMLGYVKGLKSCKTKEELMIFIEISQKNIEIEIFLIILTSLKMNKISAQFSFKKPIYTNNTLYSKPSSTITSPPKPAHKQIFIPRKTAYYVKQCQKKLEQICGFFAENSGPLNLIPRADSLGRRLLTRNKNKSYNTKIINEPPSQSASVLEAFKESNKDQITPEQLDESNSSWEILSKSQHFEEYTVDIEENDSIGSTADFYMEFECEAIYIHGTYYGTLYIMEDCLIFASKDTDKPNMGMQSAAENNEKELVSSALPETQIKVEKRKLWMISEIKEVIIRRFVQNYSAIELFFVSGKSVYLNFFTVSKLTGFYKKFKLKFSEQISFLKVRNLYGYLAQWKAGEISNFEYLMLLNKYSGRSFNDVSQYPVFPWILKDYTSNKLDLTNEEIYRNLRYPVCAQTPEDRARAKRNFNNLHDEIGCYHFGSHYSAGGIILHYLLRIEPFTQENLNLHLHCFDLPDRLFYSIKKSWEGTQFHATDTKELIPEFFYLPEMFINLNKINFGHRQNTKIVDDVNLPRWSKGSVINFLSKHRKALESAHCTANLPYWIDMIFGYKQKGKPAEAICNVFHPITYEDKYKEIVSSSPESFQRAYFCQAYHYGQIPIQLFKSPHPHREAVDQKLPAYERLLSNHTFDCTRKLAFPSEVLILVTDTYLIVLKNDERLTFTKYRWSAGSFDSSSGKEVTLMGVFYCKILKAAVSSEESLVTSGYPDLNIYVHDFNGEIQRILHLHTMPITSLIGGNHIISSSLDSSIAIWDLSTLKYLQGHLSSVLSISLMEEYCILLSCSQYILIHDIRTAEILKKINDRCEVIMGGELGLICVSSAEELHMFTVNGIPVKNSVRKGAKQFLLMNDCLFIEESTRLVVLNTFDSEECFIYLQEPLEVAQMVYSKNKDLILFVNRNNNGCSLYCLEVSLKEKREI